MLSLFSPRASTPAPPILLKIPLCLQHSRAYNKPLSRASFLRRSVRLHGGIPVPINRDSVGDIWDLRKELEACSEASERQKAAGRQLYDEVLDLFYEHEYGTVETNANANALNSAPVSQAEERPPAIFIVLAFVFSVLGWGGLVFWLWCWLHSLLF